MKNNPDDAPRPNPLLRLRIVAGLGVLSLAFAAAGIHDVSRGLQVQAKAADDISASPKVPLYCETKPEVQTVCFKVDMTLFHHGLVPVRHGVAMPPLEGVCPEIPFEICYKNSRPARAAFDLATGDADEKMMGGGAMAGGAVALAGIAGVLALGLRRRRAPG